MKDSLKTFVYYQGQRLSLEVWGAGLDEVDPKNKQYKFGMQVIQIPMSGMIRFNALFIHEHFGDFIDLNKILPIVYKMVKDHIGAFINSTVSIETCEEWLIESKNQA